MKTMERSEAFEKKYRSVYRLFIGAFMIFVAGWLARFVAKTAGTLPDWLDYGFAGILILTVPLQFYAVVRMNALKKKAATDAELNVFFTDERVKAHEKSAWKYGFIAMAVVLGVLGVISIFAELTDANGVIFTALWAGFGGYHLSFYLLERG